MWQPDSTVDEWVAQEEAINRQAGIFECTGTDWARDFARERPGATLAQLFYAASKRTDGYGALWVASMIVNQEGQFWDGAWPVLTKAMCIEPSVKTWLAYAMLADKDYVPKTVKVEMLQTLIDLGTSNQVLSNKAAAELLQYSAEEGEV